MTPRTGRILWNRRPTAGGVRCGRPAVASDGPWRCCGKHAAELRLEPWPEPTPMTPIPASAFRDAPKWRRKKRSA